MAGRSISCTFLKGARCEEVAPGEISGASSVLPSYTVLQQVEEMCARWEEFCGKQAGRDYLDLSSNKKKEEVRQLLWKGLPMSNKCRRSRVKLWERCELHVAHGDFVCVSSFIIRHSLLLPSLYTLHPPLLHDPCPIIIILLTTGDSASAKLQLLMQVLI